MIHFYDSSICFSIKKETICGLNCKNQQFTVYDPKSVTCKFCRQYLIRNNKIPGQYNRLRFLHD
jgi:hypothetical protein